MLAELPRRLKTLHLYGMAAEPTEMGAERVRKLRRYRGAEFMFIHE
jgi:hypothetical protein